MNPKPGCRDYFPTSGPGLLARSLSLEPPKPDLWALDQEGDGAPRPVRAPVHKGGVTQGSLESCSGGSRGRSAAVPSTRPGPRRCCCEMPNGKRQAQGGRTGSASSSPRHTRPPPDKIQAWAAAPPPKAPGCPGYGTEPKPVSRTGHGASAPPKGTDTKRRVSRGAWEAVWGPELAGEEDIRRGGLPGAGRLGGLSRLH